MDKQILKEHSLKTVATGTAAEIVARWHLMKNSTKNSTKDSWKLSK